MVRKLYINDSGEVANKFPNRKQIGAKLRKIRLAHHLKQEDVATQIGMSQNCYSKIEMGVTNISLERLLQIADVLKVHVLELLTI